MGILKHLLGGGHGSRHGYGSHGNRHGQNGSYGDPNLNPQPRQAALACGACGAAQAAGGRFCAQCGASLTPAACVQCRATLAPAASFCGQCGARVRLERPRAAARRCVARMRDAVLMAVSTRAQDALDDGAQAASTAVSARWPALAWRRPVRERPARHAAPGMHMRGHPNPMASAIPPRAAGPASRVPSNMAASSGSSPEAAPAARNRAPAVAWAVAACWRASAARSA